ncbi:PAS domain-containing protein [Ensifer sp.]|uniref:PAS domain-containing protein n=1 Tax=Ensifer sp. TaxID=1872086 RepID=UPI002897C7D5|nr:PAS domain-containing protein [Ensifer sp.]
MRSNTSMQLFQYWNFIRGERELPCRSEIEPSALRTLLPELFILERDHFGGIKFRLAGTHVCALFDCDLRGEQFATLWFGTQAGRLLQIGRQVMTQHVPVMLSATGRTEDGRDIETELLMLPLASSEGRSDRILGALAPLSRPYWLHATAVSGLDVTGLRVLDPDRTAVFLNEPVMDETISPEIRRVQHLRVFEGGRDA